MNDTESNLTIRIPDDLKNRYIKWCKSNDTNASRELRRYIAQQLRKHSHKQERDE